jgi:hypothetical protein
MIVDLIKIVIMGAFVVLLACVVGLFIMAGVAQSHDVVRLPVPSGTFIAGTQPTSDHSDAYVAPLKINGFSSIERVAQQAFHRGQREVFRSDNEVAYEGQAPGLEYYISYVLTRETSPPTLAVATTVRIKEKKGRYYYMVANQVYRRLLPYMLDRMAIMAPD